MEQQTLTDLQAAELAHQATEKGLPQCANRAHLHFGSFFAALTESRRDTASSTGGCIILLGNTILKSHPTPRTVLVIHLSMMQHSTEKTHVSLPGSRMGTTSTPGKRLGQVSNARLLPPAQGKQNNRAW